MRRAVLVAALAVTLSPLFGAEPTAPSPDVLASTVVPEGSVRVTLSKNGNIRFAPTIQSRIIVTLPAGSEVELLAPAKVAGWYVMRFPREGTAWVHSKVLQAVDGGKRWRVIEDKARARDDSTLGAGIVAQLNKGEILEDKGRMNGDWRAVTLPNAVAYISSIVLDMPSDMATKRKESSERAAYAAQIWTNAQGTYATFYDELQKNPQNAVALDWEGLASHFDVVIRDHADTDIRTSAQRLKDGIVNVAAAAANLRAAKGLPPVEAKITLPPIATHTTTTATTPTATTTTTATKTPAGVVDHGDPTVPKMLTIPGQPEQTPTVSLPVPPAEVASVPVAKPLSRTAFAAEGFVSQQKFEALGVGEVLVDSDSNVVAFLKVAPGKDVQLSEYYWRWVGVYGAVETVDPATHGLGRAIPLVIVDDLALSH